MYPPGLTALQEIDAVPEPVIVVVLMLPHVSPLGTESVSVIVPANPFKAVRVMVVVVLWPALTVVGTEAVIVKSGILTVNVIIAEWMSELLVPITVIAYVPPEFAVHVSVAVPDPMRLDGIIVLHVSPVGMLSVNATVPANPF